LLVAFVGLHEDASDFSRLVGFEEAFAFLRAEPALLSLPSFSFMRVARIGRGARAMAIGILGDAPLRVGDVAEAKGAEHTTLASFFR
jgi:hypothetical protein